MFKRRKLMKEIVVALSTSKESMVAVMEYMQAVQETMTALSERITALEAELRRRDSNDKLH